MAKLYEIINEIENFDFDIDEETGEILNAADLEGLELERDVKIENICLWIKNLKADAEAYKNEKLSFADKQRRAEAKAESLKKYMAYVLDGQKFKTDRVQVSWRKSETVEVEDVLKLPPELQRLSVEPDKKSIKERMKAGEDFEGVRLVEKNNITIK